VDTDSSYHDDSDETGSVRSTGKKGGNKRNIGPDGVEYGRDGKPLSGKQQRRRQQNRSAAATSREKKKMYVSNLETQVNQLLQQQKRMMEQMERLAQENRELKQLAQQRLSSSSSAAAQQAETVQDGASKSDGSSSSVKTDVVANTSAGVSSDVENAVAGVSAGSVSVSVVGKDVNAGSATESALLPVCRTGAPQPLHRIHVQPTMPTPLPTPAPATDSLQSKGTATSFDYPVMNTLQRRRQEHHMIMQQAVQTVACITMLWTLINPFAHLMPTEMESWQKSWLSSSPMNSPIFYKIWMRQLQSLTPPNGLITAYPTPHSNKPSTDYSHKHMDWYRDIELDSDTELELAKHLSRVSLLEETPDDFRREVEWRQLIANAA